MKTKLFFSALIAASLLAACSNEDKLGNTEGITTKSRGENYLAALQGETYNGLVQNFRFEAGKREQVKFKSDNGVIIIMNPSQLTLNGSPYNGPVTVKYTEIFDRANMIMTNNPTMGAQENSDSGNVPLDSAGEFQINVFTEEGQALDDGANYQLLVPADLTGGADEQMIVWEGETDEQGDLTWVKDVDENGDVRDVPVNSDNKYELNLREFGKWNIDRVPDFVAPGTQATDLKVIIPAQYYNSNTRVYIALQGAQSLVGQLKDNGGGSFDAGPYIPLGYPVHLIVVSSQSGGWEICTRTITMTPNHIETVLSSDIVPATATDVSNIINLLP